MFRHRFSVVIRDARRTRLRFLTAAVAALVAVACSVLVAEEPEFSPQQIEFFEKHVRPLLVERCHKCHAVDEPKGGLRLDFRESLLTGGDTGPAIVPGKPDESELIRAIRYEPDGYQMPPDGKLPDDAIAKLTEWVAIGAPWPSPSNGNVATSGAPAEPVDFEKRAEHWSFQPLERPAIPAVQHPEWCRTPVDRFLLARPEAEGITPAPETDRRIWLRRASFDVIGLPPTPEEVEAFVNDQSPDAFDRVIERLLASPHFGERWGRHWLDLVRYAESRGHEFDHDVANPWHYRDYVIRALNDDVPYDQFVVEHVAGDLLESQSTNAHGLQPVGLGRHLRLHPQTGGNESILATGFWFLGEWVHSPVDIRQDEADRFENMIDVYSKTFLGLTVACARCHDHKFDPIRQKDYYALQGYLQSSVYQQVLLEDVERRESLQQALDDLNRRAIRSITLAYSQLLNRQFVVLPDVLLEAKSILQFVPGVRRVDDTDVQTRIQEAAKQKGLDPQQLTEWVEHLLVAESDREDPFHLWACAGRGNPSKVHQAIEIKVNSVAAPDEELVDSGDEFFDAPIQFSGGEGFTFPFLDPGVIWGNVDGPPIRQLFFGAHVRDSAWDALQVSPNALVEPGATSNWSRPGRTLRTDTFLIKEPYIHCLVTGGVNVYVAVDSHLLIRGPLHGTLAREFPNNKRETRWIEIDATRYQGHRAHLEFSSRLGEPCAVHAVTNFLPFKQIQTFGARAIGERHLWSYLDGNEAVPADEELAQILTNMFIEGVPLDGEWSSVDESRSLGMPTYIQRPVEEFNWILEHPTLFGLDRPETRELLGKVAEPFSLERAALHSAMAATYESALAMLDGTGEDEYVFIRGNWKKRGEVVPRRFLEVFGGERMPRPKQGSGRLELARWMVDPAKTPILPRVIVNRIWQHYFGRGIVPTPDDFGHMGRPPSHPELLDWLASELVDSGWSLKHVHRLILTSAAYRMTSEPRTSVSGPEERGETAESGEGRAEGESQISNLQSQLFARMPVKRLEGEIIRDAMLALSGRLDDRLFGRSVPVHLTPFMEGRGRPEQSGPVDGAGRRSLYIAVRRNFPDPFFQAFDMPNPHTTIGLRTVSNVPAQALALLNNPIVIEQSQRWAERLLREHPGTDTAARIRAAYHSAFSRDPTDEELAAAEGFLMTQSQELNLTPDDPRIWADLCHVLFNAKEFVFVR